MQLTTLRAVMDQAISAAEANRSFSRLLREVREGRSYVVTAHGKPVARIVPCDEADLAREKARAVLLERLARQPVIDIGPWTRDELYER
nr:type II toxin-antitoxin system prevent-host-death family antitoxin [uncultured Rhodopila sp.]